MLGVWGGASRQPGARCTTTGQRRTRTSSGPWTQVSRLGNPLFNEVDRPAGKKDRGTRRTRPRRGVRPVRGAPGAGAAAAGAVPGRVPEPGRPDGGPRADLVAILLTGIPPGIVPGFQNFTGNTLADMLRLNVAIPPAASPNPLGLLGGDIAGFPNGRRRDRRRGDDRAARDRRRDVPARRPVATRPTARPSLITEGLTPAADRSSRPSRTSACRTTASRRRAADRFNRRPRRRCRRAVDRLPEACDGRRALPPRSRAPHDHDHTHHERYADRTHPEFVVLEIGGELGALIIYTDA